MSVRRIQTHTHSHSLSVLAFFRDARVNFEAIARDSLETEFAAKPFKEQLQARLPKELTIESPELADDIAMIFLENSSRIAALLNVPHKIEEFLEEGELSVVFKNNIRYRETVQDGDGSWGEMMARFNVTSTNEDPPVTLLPDAEIRIKFIQGDVEFAGFSNKLTLDWIDEEDLGYSDILGVKLVKLGPSEDEV